MDNKADRTDIMRLEEMIDELKKKEEEENAAGSARPYVHNYRCLSCDKFLPVLHQKSYPAIPKDSLPANVSDSLAPKIHYERHMFHKTTTPQPPQTPKLQQSPRLPAVPPQHGRPHTQPAQQHEHVHPQHQHTHTHEHAALNELVPQPPAE